VFHRVDAATGNGGAQARVRWRDRSTDVLDLGMKNNLAKSSAVCDVAMSDPRQYFSSTLIFNHAQRL